MPWARRRTLLWVSAAAVTAALAWQATSGSPSPDREIAQQQVSSNAGPGLTAFPPGSRTAAPRLEGTTLESASLSLSDFVGKIVVVNVWGSWCGPCRAETPDLARAARELERRGVRFLGINTRDNLTAARTFAKRFDVPYPSVVDEDGQLLLGFRFIIPTAVVPTTIIIDREGKVAARVIGPITYRTLKGILVDEIATQEASS